LFAPILAVINSKTDQTIELRNSSGLTALSSALETGRVQYANGEFTGRFSVSISNDIRSFGGQFDARSRIYKCDPIKVPGFIKAAAASYHTRAKATHDEILRKLIEIQDRMDDNLKEYDVDPYSAMDKIEHGFRKSAEALAIEPELSQFSKDRLAADYNKNIKLYINDFSKQSVQSLREAVEENAMQGYRFDRLKDVIKQRYGVTANKAKFLARQETSLFMSKYRHQRFSQGGVKQYKWSTAHDERVRDSHKRLDGRVFQYDDPPITDRATGAKNAPGEDYNCRCLDIPLLDKVAEYIS
jgi:SPP1 gp7 family putative phage head morphogenesis protein